MGVRLELPHQDLPRAETALSSCLCLGRGSRLTPVRPPYLGSCLLPWLPVTGQGHTSALVSAPSTCRQPLPLTLNVQRGQPCGCPQRCCSWARVLLGRGGSALHPQLLLLLSALPSLRGRSAFPACTSSLPAPAASWGGGGLPAPVLPLWVPGRVAARCCAGFCSPCPAPAGSHLCLSPTLLPPPCAPHPFPCPPLAPIPLDWCFVGLFGFFFLINVFVQPQLHPWGSPQRGGQEDNLGCCGRCLCWGGE